MEKKCPQCTMMVPEESKICPCCGKKFDQDGHKADKIINVVVPFFGKDEKGSIKDKKCHHCAMTVPKDAKICPYCKKKFVSMPSANILVGLIVIVMLGFIVRNMNHTPNNQPLTKKAKTHIGNYERKKAEPAIVKEKSLEYMLATINDGGYVSEDHITVARFRSLLQQLSATYIENPQQIADMSVKAKELLKNDGIDEKLMNIMEAMNKLFPKKIENQKYAEYIAAYVTLRHKGQTHDQAVIGLQELLRGITGQ